MKFLRLLTIGMIIMGGGIMYAADTTPLVFNPNAPQIITPSHHRYIERNFLLPDSQLPAQFFLLKAGCLVANSLAASNQLDSKNKKALAPTVADYMHSLPQEQHAREYASWKAKIDAFRARVKKAQRLQNVVRAIQKRQQ